MEYRNIGGRNNKKYTRDNKSTLNKLDSYVNANNNYLDVLLKQLEDNKRKIDLINKENDALSREQIKLVNNLERTNRNITNKLARLGKQDKLILTAEHNLTAQNNQVISNIQKEQNKYKSLSSWYADTQETKLINRMNVARSQMTTDYINKNAYDSKGNYVGLTAKQTKAMNDEINTKLTKQFGKDIDKFGTKVALFGVAADVINEGIKILKKLGLEGINRQSDVYEKTFGNISVRTGLTRSQYYDAQRGLQVQLSERGLFNNVASSEIQQMWNTMATNGINLTNAGAANEAQLYARAIDMVVTSKIVPYLDMSSQSLNILDQRLNGKFIQDIRGINLANNEIAGNNYVTEELLKQIIDQVQPMSDEALENLASSSTEVTALINQLTPIMGRDAATSYAKQWFKADKYSDQMLRSGTLTEKMSITNALVNDINYHDPKQASRYMIESLQGDLWLTSMGQGYDSVLAGLITNTIGTATGNIERQRGLDTLLRSGKLPDIIANSRLSPEDYANYVKEATDAFTNDQNQTNEQLQNITIENFMNRLAVIKEWMGNYADVIKVAIEGIASILLGKIVLGGIGKGISALSGIGGAGVSASASGGGLFASLGAVAGSVAALAAVAVGIHTAVNSIRTKERSTASANASSYASDFTTGIGDSNNAGQLAAYSQQLGGGYKSSKWDAFFGESFFKNWAGSMDNMMNLNGYNMDDPVSYNKEKWDRAVAQTHDIMPPLAWQWAQVWYALGILDAGNSVETMTAVTQLTPDGIKAFLHEQEKDEATWAKSSSSEYMGRGLTYLVNSDLYPVGPHRGFSDLDYTEDQFKEWGVYRTGLSSVPYDNFPALLHENEAVLTASTANELRNLIVEYRNNRYQSINFETAIQKQTISLVNKLNEVVNAINNLGTTTGNNRLTAVNEKLHNSMITLTSTKSFA